MAVALIAVVPASASFAIGLSTSTDNTDSTDIRPVAAPATDSLVSMASYHGRTIDLRKGWGTAAACVVAEAGTSCFDSEELMDAFIGDTLSKDTSGFRRAACSTSLRLYDATSFGGGVLGFTLRNTVINMSAVGFDNRTSSYKVGACSVLMWDGVNGTGPVYTGPMWAGVMASTMVPFWDNRIGSIYIN
jgi:hypothetical protein